MYVFRIFQISADPSDINVLAEYDSDPRVVGNLLDGVNQTRDDMHMWLTPFTPGGNHLVVLEFTIPYALALVRIWVRRGDILEWTPSNPATFGTSQMCPDYRGGLISGVDLHYFRTF